MMGSDERAMMRDESGDGDGSGSTVNYWFTPGGGIERVDADDGTRHDRYSRSATGWLEARGIDMPGLFTGEIGIVPEEEGWGEDLLGKHIGAVPEVDGGKAVKPSDVAAAEVWDSPTFWELAMDEGLPTTLKTGEGYGYLAEGNGVIAGTRTLRLTAMALDVQLRADRIDVEALDRVEADERTQVKHKAAENTEVEAAESTKADDSTAVEADAADSTNALEHTAGGEEG